MNGQPITLKIELTDEAIRVLLPDIQAQLETIEQYGDIPICIVIRPSLSTKVYGIPVV